jgi:hypothetical protein
LGYADVGELAGGAVACLFECGDSRYDDRIDFVVLEGLFTDA